MNRTDVTEAIAQLSANGRKLMETVPQMDFFDDGYRAGSGNWGEGMADQVDFKKGSFSGVINRTVKLGMWTVEQDEDGHNYFSLTELGAAVVCELCGIDADGRNVEDVAEVAEVEQPQVDATAKVGSKWTYLHAADGTLIAELKNTDLEAIGAWLRSQGLA